MHRSSRTPRPDAEVRQRTDLDLAECVRILTAVHGRDRYPNQWPADPAGWLTPPNLLEAWVADLDGVVRGHVALAGGVRDPQLLAAGGRPSDELAVVSRLFVDPASRGHALGALLLRAVRSFAQERQRDLVLEVVDDAHSAAAIALYEQLGWRLVGRRRADWATSTGVHPQLRLYVLSTEAVPGE